ncbi:DNA polymerase III subunit gamma/tau, partial [bacterium]|nr:DNA polymerase III subunit gamma/tau [bacterium]
MNEKYIPLYRKYRPQKLEEVVGQEHIKQALANAIAMDKISHAYLFTGPRGTGKTSTARIFAKSLNCVNGPTITPCGECSNCKDITNSVPMDVIEIDAASNRKVEDAQNILEKVMYAPVNSRFKIYIIDEVHMLSSTAFNALLKTLEEPPKNVVFILATTEVHKVLDTIKSRCQRFDFRRITTSDIVKHLRYISDSEKINITDDALATVAKNSAGGMRDSIALLDQLSVLGTQNAITTDDINALLGRISFDVLKELSSNILASNHAGAIEILEKIYNSGNEPVQILQNLLDYFKNLLIVKNCKPEITLELTQLNDLQIKDLTEQAKNIETHQIIALSDKCANYIKEIKSTNNPRLWLEIAIIDIANLTENTKLADLQARLSALEGGNHYVAPQREATPAPRPVPQIIQQMREEKPQPQQTSSQPIEQPKQQPAQQAQTVTSSKTQSEDFAPMPKAKASSGDDILTTWGNLLANISSPPTRALLTQLANPIKLADDGVVISLKSELHVQQFTTGNKKAVLQKAVEDLFGKDNIPITVRTPLPDDVIQKGNVNIPKS